jgi:hypothetical protein
MLLISIFIYIIMYLFNITKPSFTMHGFYLYTYISKSQVAIFCAGQNMFSSFFFLLDAFTFTTPSVKPSAKNKEQRWNPQRRQNIKPAFLTNKTILRQTKKWRGSALSSFGCVILLTYPRRQAPNVFAVGRY